MKSKLTTAFKIVMSILAFIGLYFVLEYIFNDLVKVYDLYTLKWFYILFCFLGFLFSGWITRSLPLKLTPLLFVQLLIFYRLDKFYFPFNLVLVLFAILGLFLARKEFNKMHKFIVTLSAATIFVFILFSQPLIVKKKYFGRDFQGDFYNATLLWDFSDRSKSLPDLNFYNIRNEKFDFSDMSANKIVITFWATWCASCLAEKPELEKIKATYENDEDIVFIDVSFDTKHKNWISYIQTKNPKGIQLISKNTGKDKASLEIDGIPHRILVNRERKYNGDVDIGYLRRLLSENDSIFEAYIQRTPRFIDYTPSQTEIEQMERLLNEVDN